MSRRRSGDNWGMGGTGRTTIYVIEAKDEKPEPEGATRVAFGFGRALDKPPEPSRRLMRLPHGWEGSD